MSRLAPDELKRILYSALRFDRRFAEIGSAPDTPLLRQRPISPSMASMAGGSVGNAPSVARGSVWRAQTHAGGTERRVRCVFRDDDKRTCIVHPVRPFACRLFGQPTPGLDPDCGQVTVLQPSPVEISRGAMSPDSSASLSPEDRETLQRPVMEASEWVEVVSGKAPLAFFPFEFWLLRAALGEAQAVRLYLEILVPASTPLTNFWKS